MGLEEREKKEEEREWIAGRETGKGEGWKETQEGWLAEHERETGGG